MAVVYDAVLFKEYSDRVSMLLDRLDNSVYSYPIVLDNKLVENGGNMIVPDEDIQDVDVLKWLPVRDVVNTFSIFRPLNNRTHKKRVGLGKMVYRSEGWMYLGSIHLYEEDEAVLWIVGDERLTIDKIEQSGAFEKSSSLEKHKSLGNRNSSFLARNIRCTKASYSEKEVLDSLIVNGISFDDIVSLPAKRKNPPKRKTRSSGRKKARK